MLSRKGTVDQARIEVRESLSSRPALGRLRTSKRPKSELGGSCRTASAAAPEASKPVQSREASSV